MIITAIRVIPPHNIRTEVVAEIALGERSGPVQTLSVERYPVRFEQEGLEITAHFAPHNNALSLAIVQKKEMVAQFLVCCAIPCELTFRLPSSQMFRLFCDPKQTAPRPRRAKQQPQRNALDLTLIDDYAYAQHGPVIQKRRLARPAGVADLNR